MIPCDELKGLVLRHYGMFDTGDQTETIRELYSDQEGLVIIGNDPDEWFDNPEATRAFRQAGSAKRMEITVQDIKAFCEGSVGWCMDRVTVTLPNGKGIPVRHTRIFHKEEDLWKMVHLHTSIAVPNDKVGE